MVQWYRPYNADRSGDLTESRTHGMIPSDGMKSLVRKQTVGRSSARLFLCQQIWQRGLDSFRSALLFWSRTCQNRMNHSANADPIE